MRGVERTWVGIRHAPARIRHETRPPPALPPPLTRGFQAGWKDPIPRARAPAHVAVIRTELPSANITANSTPFRATLVFRSHPRLRDRERTWRLNSSTDWKEGRKEGSQDEKEEEGRQAGIGGWTRGLAPACPRAARPPPSRIWASAQSLPAAARGTCPSLWPGADAARSGGELQAASSPAAAFHPEEARTPFTRPAASLPPNQPQVNLRR